MVSELSLDIIDTRSVNTMRVMDSSWYNKKIDTECAILEVTPPGRTEPVSFDVDEGFSIVLNSSNLKLKRAKVFSALQPLPDGVYLINYSIKPNAQIWVEYEYLRVDNLLKSFNGRRCAVKLDTTLPDKDQEAKLKKLDRIETYIKHAKNEVEFCGNRKRGIELYNYAQRLLNKYDRSDCITCK